MALGLGVGLPYFGSKGGVADAADGATSAAALFLAANGPHGMVLNFDGDASIAINDAADLLDFESSGQVSGGALVGPGAKTTYSAPSVKNTEQADGYIKFQAHNLCRNSEDLTGAAWTIPSGGTRTATTIEDTSSGAFQNVRQDITTISGATYLASFLVLKDAVPASTRFCAFNIAGSATLTAHLDTSSGVIRNVPTRLFTDVSSVSEGDSWRVTLAWTADSTNASFQIYPAVGSAADVSVTTTASQSATPTGSISVTKFHIRRTPSVDTYIATTSAAVYDLPYVHSGGVRTGIMFEPAATNLILHSTDLTNAVHSALTVTSNAGSGPFGAATMDRFVETTANSIHSTFQSTAVLSSGTAYTASVYLKYDGRNQQITFNSASHGSSQYANFDIQNGALGTVTGGTARITNVGSGVYRCEFTATATANDVGGFSVIGITSLTDTRAPSYVGLTSVGVYIDQLQLETGTVATSPIITYGAAVARAADSPLALLNLFPSIGTAYTIYAKYMPQSASVATTAIRLDDTTTNELVSLGNNASGAGLATVTDGGVSQASITSGTITASAFHCVAASVEANNVLLVVNGGAGVQDTSVTLPTLTRLLLGGAGGMELQQLAILPGARTEAQLQALGA